MHDAVSLVTTRLNDWLEEHPRTAVSKRNGIRVDSEFDRVDALRRRTWTEAEGIEIAARMTEILRRPGGTQVLRPIQGIALYEFAEHRGLVASVRVGGGKTLISLLGAQVIGARKPLLILPAKLIPKTKRALATLAWHWRVAAHIAIISYEWLGRVQAAEYFRQTKPDYIALDEAHKARNRRASVTRRILRYADRFNPAVMILSGTLIRKRIIDWAHLSAIALGERSPAPLRWNTVQHWGTALDHDGDMHPGALGRWAEKGGMPNEARTRAQEGYRRRVIETPGVVATSDRLLGVSLNIEPYTVDVPPVVRQAIDDLESSWTLPDGFIITDPLHYWRASRQLALGCYYRWKEQPAEEWRNARLEWSRFVRHAVRYLRQHGPFDSEAQVAGACARGEIDATAYNAWRAIRDSFQPEIEHIWLTHDIVGKLVEGAFDGDPAILWVETAAVGELLHAYGFPYYGRKGKTIDGKHDILDADPTRPLAASIKSVGEGHDLQAWARNIICAPIQLADQWEQLLGRTHRDGQTADEVNVQVAWYARVHRDGWREAMRHAKFLQTITGQEQKLLYATLDSELEPEDDE